MEEKRITKKQIILIHLALNQLKISREQYEIMLSDYWAKSSVDLSFKDAEHLIDRFVKLGFKIVTKHTPRPSRKGTNIIDLTSPQQLALIEHLREEIRWHVEDGYFRWLRKWLKKDRITTSREASRVIEGLKGMLARQQRDTPLHPSQEGTQETQETQETSLRQEGGGNGRS
jgi:hypothetical protein